MAQVPETGLCGLPRQHGIDASKQQEEHTLGPVHVQCHSMATYVASRITEDPSLELRSLLYLLVITCNSILRTVFLKPQTPFTGNKTETTENESDFTSFEIHPNAYPEKIIPAVLVNKCTPITFTANDFFLNTKGQKVGEEL